MFTSSLIQIFAGQQYSSTFAGGTALNLYRDFLNDTQLNGPVSNYRIGPDLSFNRNTFATYYSQSNGIQTAGFNEPRFEYSPIDSNLKGLLIEPPSTNLVEYSTNFNGGTWIVSVSGVTLTSNVTSTTAPDFTETATLITNTTSDGFHIVSWDGAPAPWTGNNSIPIEYYSRSVFLKKETARYIILSVAPEPSAFGGGENPQGSTPNFDSISNIFDIDTGTFVEFSVLDTNIENIGSGWYRVNIGRNSTNLTTNRLTIGISNGPTFQDTYYTGQENSLSGVYVWGAQVEKNILPTSYIPTNGTQVTRAGDNITLTRIPFGKIYNPNESSILIKGTRKNIFDNNSFISLLNRNFTKYWSIGSSLSSDRHSLVISTVLTALNTDTVVPNVSYKLTAGLKDNDIILYQDDTFVASLTTGALPIRPFAINQLHLGRFNDTGYLNGYIQEFGYWPTRLTNQQLSSL